MRKTALLIAIAALIITPTQAHAQSSHNDQNIIESYEMEGTDRYVITPTDEARTIGSSALSSDYGPALSRVGIPATDSLAGQLACHSVFASDKDTWNLEAWRPHVSLTSYISSQCNPR